MAVLSSHVLVIIGFQLSSLRRAGFDAKQHVTRWLLAAALCFVAASTLQAQAPARENEVKATLLFNFCHFVQWPAKAFADDSTPFVIGILGRDPFGKFIDDLVKGEETHGRPIQVRRFSRVEEITTAHLLYVSLSEQGRVRHIIPALGGRPLLSVGEASEPGFARFGGMVEFTTDRGNIKIRINLDEARNAGLVISTKLLRLSELARTQN